MFAAGQGRAGQGRAGQGRAGRAERRGAVRLRPAVRRAVHNTIMYRYRYQQSEEKSLSMSHDSRISRIFQKRLGARKTGAQRACLAYRYGSISLAEIDAARQPSRQHPRWRRSRDGGF